MFIPEHKEIIIGVHVLFNEIIASYSENYYQKIKELKVKAVEEESIVNHLPIHNACVILTTKITCSTRLSKLASRKDT